jgi:hypothetical protein
MPSTETFGYARATAMLETPPPHARSATRAGGSASRRSCTARAAGSHSYPSRCR